MRSELLVPPYSSTADWPRKVAAAVKYLLQAASDAIDSIAALDTRLTANEATDTTQNTSITSLGTRVTALEAVSGVALAHPFVQLSAAPGSPTEGQTYYDTTLHKARTWDGTAWQAFW